MDRTVEYAKLLKETMYEYHELTREPSIRHPDDRVIEHFIADDTHRRYMLFRVGWWGPKRIRSAGVYAYIENGKIHIEEDWTEDGIATPLLAAGVPRSDIVLGFHDPV